MQEVSCGACGGSGKARRGEMLPMDWSYDFSYGFQSVGMSEPGRSKYIAERVARVKALFERLKPGDRFESSGQFTHTAVEIGMYDGWPFWAPTPAISYVGPLGSIEYDFYYNVSEPWREREAAAR